MAPLTGSLGSLRSHPISIDDDTPLEPAEITAERLRKHYLTDRSVRNEGLNFESPIVLEDSFTQEDIEKETRLIDLTINDGPDNDLLAFHQHGDILVPSPLVNTIAGERELRQYTNTAGLKLCKGITVQIPIQEGPFSAEFLKVAAIIQLASRKVILRGHLYARAKFLSGLLERKLNEVALIADVVRSFGTDWNRQAMVDHSVDEVNAIRILRTTNTAHPLCGIDRHDYVEKGREWVVNHGHLVCRWHYITVFKDERAHRAGKADEWLVRRVTQADADRFCAIEDTTNIRAWRGGNILGGSVTPMGEHEDVDTVDQTCVPPPLANRQEELQNRAYSAGDVFAGAGGVSRGIQDAKLKIVFALDHWERARETYRSNFPSTTFHHEDVFNFVTNPDVKYRVDILHMSPPCQYWSPAHTVPGQNDEPNVAALYSCGHIIDKVRPRIFTVEQTFGILFTRFTSYFNTFIGGFTSQGYSVRWRLVNFASWGSCQTRTRLLVIGAAPGEHLPDFPKETHFPKPRTGVASGYSTFRTVKDVFENLSMTPGRFQHDVKQELERAANSKQKFEPWDWNRQVGTITCSGGQHNHHWNRRTKFTIREFAYIQGFPLRHRFSGSRGDCVKQIGNAVPPTIAKRLFEHIIKFLKIQDGATSPSSIEARSSEARQRHEMIKIDGVADTDDDELTFASSVARNGSSADNAIELENGDGTLQVIMLDDSEEDDDSDEESTNDSDDGTGDADLVLSDGEESSPHSSTSTTQLRSKSYCQIAAQDQLPPSASSRLGQFKSLPMPHNHHVSSPLRSSAEASMTETKSAYPSPPATPYRPVHTQAPVDPNAATAIRFAFHPCSASSLTPPGPGGSHNTYHAEALSVFVQQANHNAGLQQGVDDLETASSTSSHTLIGDNRRIVFDHVLRRRIIQPVSQRQRYLAAQWWVDSLQGPLPPPQ